MVRPAARPTVSMRFIVSILFVVLFGAAVITSCSSEASDSESARESDEADATDEPTPAPTTVEDSEQPPEVVVIARGDWASGYFQAEVFAQLIAELGYDVSEPAATEVGPSSLYPAMARGEIDLWANGWFPHHDQFLEVELSSGAKVADAVTVVGDQIPSGGVLGFLVSKWWAEDLNIAYVDDIGQNGDLAGQLDADGDGRGDIIGCDVDWPCHDDINAMINANDWRLDQLSADYDQLFSGATSRVANGLPTLVFTWAPSSYVGALVPGEEMVWLGVRNPLDDASVAGSFDPGVCQADPCQTGFDTADIRAVANSEFLAEHPDIAALLEAIEIPAADVAAQNLLLQADEESETDISGHATDWIKQNRETVDTWLDS